MKTYFADVWKVNSSYFSFLIEYWKMYVVLIAVLVGLVSILVLVYERNIVDYLIGIVSKFNDFLIRRKDNLENC